MNRKNITQLLDNPLLGVDSFSSTYTPDDKSNCFGTALFAKGCYESDRPLYMSRKGMVEILESHFSPSVEKTGAIISFWNECDVLQHTGLAFNENEMIHQENFAQPYSSVNIEEELVRRNTTRIGVHQLNYDISFPVIDHAIRNIDVVYYDAKTLVLENSNI